MPKPPGRRDGELRAALLWAGFAQLDALGLPPHAAVDATVDAARANGRAHQAGLVNALLRRALREPPPQVDAGAAWPEWLAKRLRNDWPEDADAVFAESVKPAPMWLRVNRRRGSRDDYAQRLREAGIEAVVVDGMVDALRLEHALPVAELPGFDAGDVSVQDGSAQAVADALSPPAGSRVLDACAAPGGKSAAPRRARSDAAHRRARRRRAPRAAHAGHLRAARAGDRIARRHATDPAAWRREPRSTRSCSTRRVRTGIVRRQPDVLLHRRESDLAGAHRVAVAVAGGVVAGARARRRAALRHLFDPATENADQIRAFLARHPDARLEPLDARFGRDTGFGAQRLPGEGGMDGFFYARLRKR